MNAPAASSLTRPTVIENEAVEKKDSEISWLGTCGLSRIAFLC
jgi:hypothetical protein